MATLEWSDVLKRKVRRGTLYEVAVPTWTLIKDAARAGNVAEAVELVDYAAVRARDAYTRLGVMADELLTVIADKIGEEAIEGIWRARYGPRVDDFLRTSGTVEEFMSRMLEVEVGHHNVITVTEEKDRYVAKYDPCGSGGAVWRTAKSGTLKKAYLWTWGKAGVSYYCAHCGVREILLAEKRGYPLDVTECPLNAKDPCIRYFYKKPDLIPEKYFARIGMKRDPAKFR